MLTYNDVIEQCTMLNSEDIIREYCISNPSEVNRSDILGQTPVFYALAISNIDICAEMIEFLCKNGANINHLLNNGDSILKRIMYYKGNRIRLLKVCLDNGANTNLNNMLKLAFQNDFILEAKLFLEYDANTIEHVDSASYLEMRMDINILNTKN